MALPPTRDSAVSPCFLGCLAFLHRHFPPQSPCSHSLGPCLRSQQQPSPWDCSTIPEVQLPVTVPSRDLRPCPEYVWLWQGLSDSHSIWLPQISCFTLSLKCFSSDSDNCPGVGIRPLLPSSPAPAPPTTEGRSSPTNTRVLPLVPSSYWIFHGSVYSFPLVRYSCLPSAGALCALLCLKVYS